MDELVGEHFGRVPTYTIVDTDNDNVEIVKNETIHTGGAGYAPDLLADHNIDNMICAGLGRRAITLFEEKGIMVYIGASGTVKEAIEMFNKGTLQAATNENACAQHLHRGEGTGDGHGHGGGHGQNCG